MKTVISTEKAPKAIGPYSQGVRAGEFLFISGQLPIDPEVGMMAAKDISAQTRQSLENIKSILEASGMAMEDVVKTSVYLSDMNNFKQMNEVYSGFFIGQFPARVAMEVSRLPKDALVEIEAIAYRG
ncbi:MAG: hypothetical protein A2X49_06305 [Lentisphaerae bacterium GWF2_52_8]|nr:MAG: hypothetical protein A2X49_06305 [Lentisphaerae bacterium GWF2_52_8]